MVELTLTHYSESFQTDMQINVIVKNHKSQEDARILYLLHGYNGDFHSWNRGTRIFSYLKKLTVSYPIFVIMPSAYNTYYTDIYPNLNAKTYIMDELPQFIMDFFPQCTHMPQYTNIAGLSMGGYGALAHYFLHPTKFNQVASFAGAVDISKRFITMDYHLHTVTREKETSTKSSINKSEIDLFELATQITKQERNAHKLTLYCGTGDHLLQENRMFNLHLQSLGFKFSYEEQEGYEHNWDHWDLCLKRWLSIIFI